MAEIEQIIGYQFKNAALLAQALTHPSASRMQAGVSYNNQRLEFLGDAVLGLVVATMLYELYPSENEGDLARRHAALVRSETLHQVVQSLGLGRFVEMSASEGHAGGRENQSNMEDACEALIGAIYLDGGLPAAEQFVRLHWQPLAEATVAPPRDPKTALQEWVQARGKPLPVYQTMSSSGPAHAPLFTIEVQVVGMPPCSATGTSKRIAEQGAAAAMLDYLEAHD